LTTGREFSSCISTRETPFQATVENVTFIDLDLDFTDTLAMDLMAFASFFGCLPDLSVIKDRCCEWHSHEPRFEPKKHGGLTTLASAFFTSKI